MAISTAVQASAVARVLGIKTEFVNLRGNSTLFLPQRVAIVGQGSSAAVYSLDKFQATRAVQVAERFGSGSPVHLAAKQLLPENGDGVGSIPVTIYPLEDAGTGVASTGDVTPVLPGLPPAGGVASEYRLLISNTLSEAFVIDSTDTVATIVTKMTTAVNAVLDMPVIATDSATQLDLAAKWAGVSGNALTIEVVGDNNLGITFTQTNFSGGLVNPDVQPALDLVGDVWETMFLNCLDIADTTTLDLFSTFGEGRWGALTRKPCVVFTGNTATTVANAIVVSDSRKTDRTNSQLVSPGSNDLPLAVAARQLARIAVLANNNPPHDYGSQQATGLTPGIDGDQWTYSDRDQAVKAGSSTIEVKDGVVNVSDVVTFYHPDLDPNPAYRYVVDIVKLQNIIFNVSLEFATAKWDGAPLIPDGQPTVNPDAKSPKSAVAAAAAIVDGLGLNAIISDTETAKAGIRAEIDAGNPKRLNLFIPVQLSGNTNIISIDLDFGFFFGTAALAA